MATQPSTDPGRRALPAHATSTEASLGATLRDLAADVGQLVRQEIQLAKLELAESLRAAMIDSLKIAVALGFALIGGLCFVVFMILGVGALLGGAYWAGALITAAILLLVGGLLTMSAVRDLKRHPLKPKQTAETLREDARFARREAVELKRRVLGTS